MSNMMNKKSIEDVDVSGKRVLLRCDLNVPIHGGVITDLNRINASIPTIKYLVEHKAKLIICSHLGKDKDRLSIKPVHDKLEEVLGQKIKFVASDNVVDENVKKELESLKEGEIAMLENTRLNPGESKNDEAFSKELAGLCDVFVADAFGTCHRGHASNYGITKFVPVSVAGYLIKAELEKMVSLVLNPVRPFITILGGAKISDKLKVIDKALERSDKVIIGGGMSYTFAKGMGYEIGKSLVDDTQIEYCMQMLEKAKKIGVELLLPIDCLAAKEFPEPIDNKNVDYKVFDIDKIDKDYEGLDIGPKTIELFVSNIKNAKTIVWNGPMGLFENENFCKGTKAIAETMASLSACNTIIGGGDSASAVNEFGLSSKMTHVSTGGGATLEFLKGEPMPGIECLTDK